MSIRHELDTTGRAHLMGSNAEQEFVALAKAKGYEVIQATSKQDAIEKWDFLLKKGESSIKVEVKSQKGFFITTPSGRLTKDFFLVEFTGVTGYKGWLYGYSDIVAFQTENGFYMVPRKTLMNVAHEKCKGPWVKNKKEMLYNRYGREGRQDEVSAVLVSDILETKNSAFWKK